MLLVVTVFMTSGCEFLKSKLTSLNGEITGNTYTIDTFDNFGTKVLATEGQKINIENNIVEEQSYSSDAGWMVTQTLSAAITINIDGKQMVSCGDTCIFYENGLTPDVEFSIEEINSSSSGAFSENTIVSGMINDVKNKFGKPVVVVIKSQTGYPIYAFSGDSVYWEIPDNLPKFTKLSVDGKALYIHRANFQIIDLELID